MTNDDNSGTFVLIWCVVGIAVLAYFLPSIIAFHRGHRHKWPILAINTFFGITIFGYFAALIWSLWPAVKQAPAINLNVNVNEQESKPAKDTPSKNVVSDEDRLRQLAKLRSEGVITEEDFAKKKKEILGI